VLVAVQDGKPAAAGIYAGSESVSLGLNELSGQMKAMPDFSLVDQFGRTFTRQSILGHDTIVAAFHTTCHESCPIYTGLFLQLRRELPASVLLLEVTTDPWTDKLQTLLDYAGRIGASWTFLTGDPAELTEFWRPFDIELSTGDVHRSTLVLIDSHGYIRSYYLGTPDVGGNLPPELGQLLNDEGRQLLQGHGSGWGEAQVLDSLRAIWGLEQPGTAGQGQAPNFTLSTLDGRRVSLGYFRGRPVVINFWATYCVPCRREMPMLERIAKAHPKMVLLLVDERDDRGAATDFVKSLGITSTVLFDTDGKAGDLYQVSGLPTTVFVRADGSIEGRYLGETNEQILDPHVAALGT
jgi:cytochrome oxidase Cu insertion factor (SCO1/SenC/PrrC family)